MPQRNYLFIIINLLLISALTVLGESPIIAISQGHIKGVSDTSRNGKLIYKFLGIPYGKIPARFHNSVPSENWKGIKDATKFGSKCTQLGATPGGKVMPLGAEDCLFINVFTPKLFDDNNTTKLLPVMVWIYGGGFSTGYADTYYGNYLTDEDVVVVTLNYRLGAFGFLNAGIKGASGNQGLKDQVLALKWVKDNIEQFGGNSNRITIFGHSAGGASVNLLTLSPMGKDLFQGAIAMSGSATCPRTAVKSKPGLKNVKMLAAALDCPTSNPEFMVECLRRVESKYILDATKDSALYGWGWEEFPQFGPSVETCDDEEGQRFLSEDPFKIATEGRFNKVPYMSGLVAHEGYLVRAYQSLNNENAAEKINEEWSRLAPSAFYYQSSLDPCKISGRIKSFYLHDKPVGKQTSSNWINLHSDRNFNHCVKEMAVALGKHTDVYLYRFNKNVKKSISEIFKTKISPNEDEQPTVHIDELQFLFKMERFYPEIKAEDDDANFSNYFSKAWASFAETGKPTELWGSPKDWSPIEPGSNTPKWYFINDETSFEIEDPEFTKRMDFWRSLPLNEYGRSARQSP